MKSGDDEPEDNKQRWFMELEDVPETLLHEVVMGASEAGAQVSVK